MLGSFVLDRADSALAKLDKPDWRFGQLRHI